MRKKYFFFDIDGTLTDRQTGKIVPSAQLALDKLQAAGHFVAIATGRAHYKAINFLHDCHLHNMVCAGGGALVLNDKLIVNHPLNNQAAKNLIQEAIQQNYGILVMLDDSIDVYAKDDLFRQQVIERKEPTRYLIDESIDYNQLDSIYKVYIAVPIGKEDTLPSLKDLGYLRFEQEYINVQYDAKDKGIIEIMEYLNAPLEDVVVFGDDMNDLVMFDERWTSIAMGNACDELKEKATYVTKANVDDGIYAACESFKWF